MQTGVDVFTSTLSWILASAEEPIAGNLALLLHNYGNIFAVIFFHTRALSVEWIRFLILFLIESIPQVLRYCIYESMSSV